MAVYKNLDGTSRSSFTIAAASSADSATFNASGGFVGLGTSTPDVKFEVVGDVISNGTAWEAGASAADNNWRGIAYGNGRFVAVGTTGTGNRVMTSDDGVNWETQTSASDSSWLDVCYGNGIFVAVGVGVVMTSPDGITWTSRTPAVGNFWQSVCYGKGKFVAVSNNGTGDQVMTSVDGIVWESQSNPVDLGWFGVTYGNETFVAVANTGTGNRVMTSPDGETWTSRSSAADNNWTDVTYGKGIFVAVAWSGTGNRVMTSDDGVTWSTQTTPADNNWTSITYGGGLFVAVATSGTSNRVMTSVDGSTWRLRASALDNDWYAVAYGNGVFAAVAQTGTANRVMTSGMPRESIHQFDNIYQGGMTIHGRVYLDDHVDVDKNGRWRLRVDSAGGTTDWPRMQFNWSNGTIENPTQVLNGETIFGIQGLGYGTTGYGSDPGAEIQCIATEDQTDAAHGAMLKVLSIPNGSVTPVDSLVCRGARVGIANDDPDGVLDITPATIGTDSYSYNVRVTNAEMLAMAGMTNGARVYNLTNQAPYYYDGSSWVRVGEVAGAGTVWDSIATPAVNSWQGVCYGNKRFVAVGQGGTGTRVMTSDDGASWELQTSAADNNWQSVCYGNGLFVAIASSGSGNRIMTSPDGLNWTIQSSPVDNNWIAVTYGNGTFVAIAISGTGDRAMTSPDGVNWTEHSVPNALSWTSVVFGNGTFVAVAQSGTGNRVMTSEDGETWTSRTSAADNNWIDVTYGNGQFVAVSYTGTLNRVMTSPDGITWTIQTTPVDNSWYCVTYGEGIYVAAASSGTGNRIMISEDAVNWTIQDSAADNEWRDICYGNGKFVAVSQTGTADFVQTSGVENDAVASADNIYQGGMTVFGNVGLGTTTPDGVFDATPDTVTTSTYTYGARVTNTEMLALTGMTAGAEVFNTTANAPYYYDGTTWIPVSQDPVASTWVDQTGTPSAITIKGLCYGNGIFVAVAETGTGNRVATSADGVTWEYQSSAADYSWQSVCYGNGLFVAVSLDGAERIMTSPDGETWTLVTAPANNLWTSVAYGNGQFVAVARTGTSNRVMTSPDGANWSLPTYPNDNDWNSVCWGNGQFVAVAQTGTGTRVMTSPDGTNWTSQTSVDQGWLSVCYGNGQFVSVGYSGQVATSPDGATWTAQTSGTTNDWRSVTYGNGQYVAVASSGTDRTMTSPDGVTWTPVTVTGRVWYAVTYHNGIFVAGSGAGGGTTIQTSGVIDGIEVPANNIYQGGMSIHGQLGVGNTSPDGVLDATPDTITTSSYSYGTRVTNTEMLALTGMTAGARVFNTTAAAPYYYDGATWVNISASVPSGPIANIPSTGSESDGDQYYATDIFTMFQYEQGWKPVISYGDVDMYVNTGTGSDAAGNGYAVGTPFATLAHMVSQIPAINGGNVTVHVASGTYTEDFGIKDKIFHVEGTFLTIQGEWTTVVASTALTSATQGNHRIVDGLGTITLTGAGWGVDAHRGLMVYNSGLDEYRLIYGNTSDTLSVLEQWSGVPSGNFTIYDWGTEIKPATDAIEISRMEDVVLDTLNFIQDGTGINRLVRFESTQNGTISKLKFDQHTASNQLGITDTSEFQVYQCWFETGTGTTAIRVGRSKITTHGCMLYGPSSGSPGISGITYADILVADGTVIDGYSYGLSAYRHGTALGNNSNFLNSTTGVRGWERCFTGEFNYLSYSYGNYYSGCTLNHVGYDTPEGYYLDSISNGNTSATFALRLTNNASLPLLKVQDDGTVGIQTATPDGVLDVTPDTITTSSYSYGVRVTNTEMLALTGMTTGARVFNTTDNSPYYYDGTSWVRLSGSSPGDIPETSFAMANNQVAPANVTGLAFANATVRSFHAHVSVIVNATSSLYEVFTLEGIQRGADWLMTVTSTSSPSSNITFSITTAGQIQYTSGNEAGWTSTDCRFRATVTGV